jgi:hypothetical protein
MGITSFYLDGLKYQRFKTWWTLGITTLGAEYSTDLEKPGVAEPPIFKGSAFYPQGK